MYEIIKLNGKAYPVRFGMNALRLFCNYTNKSLTDIEKLGVDMTLDDACYLILAGITDGCRKSGQKFEVSVESIADDLDDDMDAIHRFMEVFANQYTAKPKKGAKVGKEKAKS